MQYKTIVLEMLKDRKELHEQLRLTRRLLPTMERCARELKASHEQWKETLAAQQPGSDPAQIASEALELALKELEDRLPSVSNQARGRPAFARPGDGVRPQSFTERLRPARGQPSLFDPARTTHASSADTPPADTRPPPPAARHSRTQSCRDLRRAPPTGDSWMASGEKAKARDIIAAIRTLKTARTRTTPSQQRREGDPCPVLRFWPGRPLDFSRSRHRQVQGRRMAGTGGGAEVPPHAQTNMTAPSAPPSTPSIPRPPSSPRSTRRSAAWACPDNATILEPGCGTGNFMSEGKPGNRFIGVELDSISGRIARALASRA